MIQQTLSSISDNDRQTTNPNTNSSYTLRECLHKIDHQIFVDIIKINIRVVAIERIFSSSGGMLKKRISIYILNIQTVPIKNKIIHEDNISVMKKPASLKF